MITTVVIFLRTLVVDIKTFDDPDVADNFVNDYNKYNEFNSNPYFAKVVKSID